MGDCVIGYASRTGTRRNLEMLRRHGWRLLISATGAHRDEGFRYAIDNGAWTAHQRSAPFDAAAFMTLVRSHGAGADWIVIPDIVCGGMESLRFSLSWIDRLAGIAPLLLAVQDGMMVDDVSDVIGADVGIAVGGTTAWKESSLRQWGALARDKRVHLHVLRVNTARRIRLCHDAGADSIDGTSASRFAKTVPMLTGAIRQAHLW